MKSDQKILKSYVHSFTEQFDLKSLSIEDQFSYFAIYCSIARRVNGTPDLVSLDTDGNGDLGIDGLAILVDRQIVTSADEVDDLIKRLGRLSVEFVFIQSKSGSSFKASEIGTFLFGVRRFFADSLPADANDEISRFFDLKEYIYSKSIEMDSAPTCACIFAGAGEWVGDAAQMARVDSGVAELKATGLFSAVSFEPIDADGLQSIYRLLRNKHTAEIVFDKHVILPPVDGVVEAYLGFLPATELVKMLEGESGAIHRGLFYDNVRDYQGENPVNREINESLHDGDGSLFVLLNNGVTVVAQSITKVGNRFKLTNYQVVNGCQTSNVLFACRDGISERVLLPIKLAVTTDSEVTNKIIRATNRQTVVLDEAFESLRPFHRKLEEYYSAVSLPSYPLYYERRSNQYASSSVSPDRVVTLPFQSKVFLAMFLDSPHSTHRYYGEILSSNRGRMFADGHHPAPYYTAALCGSRLRHAARVGELDRSLKIYRDHILLMIRILVGGPAVPAFSSKKIEEYCDRISNSILDDKRFMDVVQQASDCVLNALAMYDGDRKNAWRIKDFTTMLLGQEPRRSEVVRGVIKKYDGDRGFGFIDCDSGESIFFHVSEIKGESVAESLVSGMRVEFVVGQSGKGPAAKAIRVTQ